MDAELLNTMISADGLTFLSKRFTMKKFGQMTEEEILLNERMLREEKGLNPNDDGVKDLPILYFPEEAEAGGFDGGLAGGGGGGGFQGGGDETEGMDEAGDEGLDGNTGPTEGTENVDLDSGADTVTQTPPKPQPQK